jgi:O-6-methylguanine DNA methyltransferase
MAVTEYQEVRFVASCAEYPFSNRALTRYQRVYKLLQQIPTGKVSSYAALSKALSSSPRAVGGACRRNPFAPEVPCHRIICADGVSTPK